MRINTLTDINTPFPLERPATKELYSNLHKYHFIFSVKPKFKLYLTSMYAFIYVDRAFIPNDIFLNDFIQLTK